MTTATGASMSRWRRRDGASLRGGDEAPCPRSARNARHGHDPVRRADDTPREELQAIRRPAARGCHHLPVHRALHGEDAQGGGGRRTLLDGAGPCEVFPDGRVERPQARRRAASVRKGDERVVHAADAEGEFELLQLRHVRVGRFALARRQLRHGWVRQPQGGHLPHLARECRRRQRW